MIKIDNEKNSKKLMKYSCQLCDFISSNKNDFRRHLSTDKHKIITNDNEKTQKTQKYECLCGKTYKYASGLSIHKKKCDYKSQDMVQTLTVQDKNKSNDEIATLKEMLYEVVNQNKELQKTIHEMIPKIGNTNNTNNTNNNINIKIDNLTLLNDKCRDAISITDFIGSINVGVKDLLFTSEKGLANGVSNLFIEQLNNLPLVKRPIWCSDKKRKKLFIKEDEWFEDTGQEKTKVAIKNLTVKQMKNINKYKEENPDWFSNDKKKDKFLEIVRESTKELDQDKQMSIISNLLDTIHLSTDCKEELQNKE